jgi:DNA-directed RNA polymerase I, II, and III subunit RPABC3
MAETWTGSSGCFSSFEDTFKIANIDREGKPFQSVSRIEGTSKLTTVEIELDINTEIYPVAVNEDISISLVPSYSLEGADKIAGSFNIHEDFSNTIIAKYDYVMYGKIFKVTEDRSARNMSVYISFGGLIMLLKGEFDDLKMLELDSTIYLLLKKLQ